LNPLAKARTILYPGAQQYHGTLGTYAIRTARILGMRILASRTPSAPNLEQRSSCRRYATANHLRRAMIFIAAAAAVVAAFFAWHALSPANPLAWALSAASIAVSVLALTANSAAAGVVVGTMAGLTPSIRHCPRLGLSSRVFSRSGLALGEPTRRTRCGGLPSSVLAALFAGALVGRAHAGTLVGAPTGRKGLNCCPAPLAHCPT
jgi:hypothetical protein